jgi:deferrochelatase/peroxidase EfeB
LRGLIKQEDIRLNGFTYDRDAYGENCPLGAHVRRANPRTADMPGGRQGVVARLDRTLAFFHQDLRQDLIAASRFHRLLRRGREFGRFLSMDEALRPDAADPCAGLYFICLNANITRQFEFVQNAWIMSGKFGGLDDEDDPLLGQRAARAGFGLARPNGLHRRLGNMPPFVTVAGGGYFFLPGLRALRYLAGLPG